MTDFDGDGMLDLILSHGESMAQPISIFKGTQVSQAAGPRVVPIPSTSPCSVSLLPPPLQGTSNNWLRVIPRTRFGAFARGAKVVLFTRRSGAHLRIIDGGSGYLCEMEPVAHFGLGELGGQGAHPWAGATSAVPVPCSMVVTHTCYPGHGGLQGRLQAGCPATAALLQGAAAPFPTPCLLLCPGTRAFSAHQPSPGSAELAAKPSGMFPAPSHGPHVHPSGYIPVHGLSARAPGAQLREQGEALPLHPYHPPGLLSAPAHPGDPPSDGLPACRA